MSLFQRMSINHNPKNSANENLIIHCFSSSFSLSFIMTFESKNSAESWRQSKSGVTLEELRDILEGSYIVTYMYIFAESNHCIRVQWQGRKETRKPRFAELTRPRQISPQQVNIAQRLRKQPPSFSLQLQRLTPKNGILLVRALSSWYRGLITEN